MLIFIIFFLANLAVLYLIFSHDFANSVNSKQILNSFLSPFLIYCFFRLISFLFALIISQNDDLMLSFPCLSLLPSTLIFLVSVIFLYFLFQMCLNYLSNPEFSKYFHESCKYEFLLKSVQWEQRLCVQKDGKTQTLHV